MSQRGTHASGKGFMLSMMEVFDFPEILINCTRRSNSTTPLQSLALINSDFMIEQSGFFAERVWQASGESASPTKQVETVFLLALGRPPTAAEARYCEEHLLAQVELFVSAKPTSEQPARKALASLCLMLLATNEFLYIG